MLLTIDAGNTNITIGVFDQDKLVGSFRVTTKINRTSDEFGIVFKEILKANNLDANQVRDVIIASVVPNIMHSLTSAIIKYFKITPIIIEAGIKTGIRILTENPKQLGADRIVDAAGAYELYGGPVLVIDFGTATTYDLVDATGSFIAGVTAPGLRTCAKALTQEAAKLPEVEIKKPSKILAKETITSMQAGLVYGQLGQTEYIVNHMVEESGLENVKVVATGGLGNLIANETKCIDIYNPNLTLYGMKFIFDKQKK